MDRQDGGDLQEEPGSELDQADRAAALARRSAYHKANQNHPLPVSGDGESGRLVIQDEGGPTVRLRFYAYGEARMIGGITVQRDALLLYAKWLLDAALRSSRAPTDSTDKPESTF